MPRQPIKLELRSQLQSAIVVHGLAWALLGLVVAVSLVRGAGLARGHDLGTARGERLWHSFADSHPGLADELAALRPRLEPGETVWLVVPAGRYQERWLVTMARYHWPEQTLGGVYERGGSGAPPPPEATRVVLTRDGRATIVRGPGSG